MRTLESTLESATDIRSLAFKNSAADEIIGKHGKLSTVITTASRELEPLIGEVLAARDDLARVEVAEALGQATEDMVTRAAQRVSEAEKMLDAKAAKVERLRSGVAELADSVLSAQRAVGAALPEYTAQLKEAFAREWGSERARWEILLSRRAALEQLLNERLDLLEPTVQSASPTDAESEPWDVLKKLDSIIAEIAAPERRADESRRFPIAMLDKFDKSAIYILGCPCEGLEVGAKVIEKSLSRNLLRQLHALGQAVLYASLAQQHSRAVKRAEDTQATTERLAGRPEPEPKEEISEERRRWLEWNGYSGFGGVRFLSPFFKGAKNV